MAAESEGVKNKREGGGGEGGRGHLFLFNLMKETSKAPSLPPRILLAREVRGEQLLINIYGSLTNFN